MEEGGVGLVLARATELRLQISNCINKATTLDAPVSTERNPEEEEEDGEEDDEKVGIFDGEKNPNSHSNGSLNEGEKDKEQEEDAETIRLLNIRDAFESLEAQLIALQNLQQQQRYEKEVALAEIDYSRKLLLEKLQEYKGEELSVIHEASAFAGETVENNNDLLLPPYPNRPPRSVVLDSGYLSHLHLTCKSSTNGVITSDATNEANENLRNQKQTASRNSTKGLGHFISSAAKTVLPLIGVIYVLTMSNIVPSLGKRSAPLKFLGFFQQPAAEEKKAAAVRCPPGKVLVMEGGEARCLVKERVEIPFESIVAKPDVNYGSG